MNITLPKYIEKNDNLLQNNKQNLFIKNKKNFKISQNVENFFIQYTNYDKKFMKKNVYLNVRSRGGRDVSKYSSRRRTRKYKRRSYKDKTRRYKSYYKKIIYSAKYTYVYSIFGTFNSLSV